MALWAYGQVQFDFNHGRHSDCDGCSASLYQQWGMKIFHMSFCLDCGHKLVSAFDASNILDLYYTLDQAKHWNKLAISSYTQAIREER